MGFAFQFDARQVAPISGFEPWPDGWYPVVIKSSEPKPTQDGNGSYLNFVIEALDGPMRGKVNFIRLNVRNQNAKAVEMAYGQLSAICHVTGVIPMQNTSELEGKPFMALATTNKNPETGQVGNNFNAFKDMQGNLPGKHGGVPMQQGVGFGAPQGQQGFGAPQGAPQAQGFGPQPPQGFGPQPGATPNGMMGAPQPAPGQGFGAPQGQAPGGFGPQPGQAQPQGFGGAPTGGFGPQGGAPQSQAQPQAWGPAQGSPNTPQNWGPQR
jgi:hypothetical protein